MLRKFVAVLGTAGVLMLFSALSAGCAGDQVPFPHGFMDWFFVNSLSVTADSPLFARMASLKMDHAGAEREGGLTTFRDSAGRPRSARRTGLSRLRSVFRSRGADPRKPINIFGT